VSSCGIPLKLRIWILPLRVCNFIEVSVVESHCQYDRPFRVFPVKRPPPPWACWNTYVKVENCSLSIYDFPFKNPSHIVWTNIDRPSLYVLCSELDCGISSVFFSQLVVLKPFDPFMLSHLLQLRTRKQTIYQGYKCPSAPPQHCTNITLIETFTPKPTVACEILSQAAMEDLAESIKAGKDEMCSAPGRSLQWL